jgi:hypothetical protein
MIPLVPMHGFLTTLVSLIALAACAKSAPQNRPSAPTDGSVPLATPPIARQNHRGGSATVTTAEIIHAGATVPEPEGTQSAPDTSLGWVHVLPRTSTPRFLPGGTTIAARLGVSFGVELILHGPPKLTILQLRTRVTHPRIANPTTGVARTVDEWDSPMNADIPRYMGWHFDNAWELVPGVWRIELLDGQQVLVSQDFTVEISSDLGS